MRICKPAIVSGKIFFILRLNSLRKLHADILLKCKFIYYTADEIKDDSGEKALDANLGILVLVNRFVYVKKINAKSDWILHLLIPLQKTDLELTVPGGPTIVDNSQSGVGDILLEGAYYAIHKDKYDVLLAGGLIIWPWP